MKLRTVGLFLFLTGYIALYVVRMPNMFAGGDEKKCYRRDIRLR